MQPHMPYIKEFFDESTSTFSYIVYDKPHGTGAIIDPVLDYDYKSGTIQTVNADKLLEFVTKKKLTIEWILETHVHADHLSSAQYLKQKLNSNAKVAISKHIILLQKTFQKIFNLDFNTDGSDFDYLFEENEIFSIGSLSAQALFVPGHTPIDTAYKAENALFVGDSIFMPDVGTARCDFPHGNAEDLYNSIQKILSMPDDIILYMCHDYPHNRAVKYQSNIHEQKLYNIHVKDNITKEQFVSMRQTRDASLEMPALIYPSIQVNMRAGKFPQPEENSKMYLKIPLNLKFDKS